MMSSGNFMLRVIAVLLAFIGGMFIGSAIQLDMDQKEVISRGYAIYCPADGKFAWVGECDEN